MAEMERFSTLVENTFTKVEQVHGKSRLEHLDFLQDRLTDLDTELTEFLLSQESRIIEVGRGK